MTGSLHTTLVLGGTGRTGSLLAKRLAERGRDARTAARHGAEVLFDWDSPATHADALRGVDSLYLVTPVMRTKYIDQVAAFLDLAEAAGVRHVTYLSNYGADDAPPQIDIKAVEADLTARTSITHSVVRPAWVMQNFTDTHLPVISGAITVPTGSGTEAFVDAADIAAVAAETLLAPEVHAGALYAPTGPQTLTVGEVADIITAVTGQPVTHQHLAPEAWISGAVAAGIVPADYAVMLRWLTGTIISGHGSTPNEDVEKATGRKPTAFREFAQRNAHAWTATAGA
ncbi:NmrA family NAD(P)-binding protein [Streptomyces violaceusniger]|uniref:NmrA family NAD(P)-binding protein n=1 Tax=Streptomyces violaceusniger TaxID=68280 RepID=UPI0034458342